LPPEEPPEDASYDEKHTHLMNAIYATLSIALPKKKSLGNTGQPGARAEKSKQLQPPYCDLELPDKLASIRLLEILPGEPDDPDIVTRLFVADINSSASYEALSYVWGTGETLETILVNGLPMRIRPNLHSALGSIRHPSEKRVVWADGLCINQDDLAERSQQVSLMASIYSLAKNVIIYLGPSTPETTSYFNFLKSPVCEREKTGSCCHALLDFLSTRQLQEHCDTLGLNYDEVLVGFGELCLRSWWTRLWTLQEYVLSKQDPIYFCGRDAIDN
jgi:hypothetical protein